ncbi:hypothetical protein A7U60_g8084 [Sanghuangporus baumii]|uniref:RING-type domain-containing protein n=1 Tax=Sanghuangporus baumii TaxID=108892 RepID=A0A9Q5HRV9_SANBA|nr:hypothetical protein A7U60_g8084 [Sanghuangporus baumii]
MRRIQAPQTVARVDSRTSRVATAIHNGNDAVLVNPADANAGDVVINMGDLALNSPTSPTAKDSKDTLFGPSIGVVSTAPEWCAVDAVLDEKLFKSEKTLDFNEKLDDEAESDEDELTPEIVKEWVRRSKEPSEPTTTLQALVNLKRPSIRLSPLAASSSDPSASSSLPDESPDAQGKLHQQHGLEFEFDCDAPRCLISLHAFGVPASLGEPDEQDHSAHLHVSGTEAGKENERLVLFEMTLPGGFARKLTLGDGAVLELARLEAAAKAHRAQLAAAAASASPANISTTGFSGTSTPGGAGSEERHEHHRRLLTTFFRKRGNAHNNSSQSQPGQAQAPTPAPAPTIAAGPALAVVDAEAAHLHPSTAGGTISVQNQNTLATFFAGGDAEKARRKKEAEEEGVRVAIRITARDSEGRPMKVRNEQVTYLHIVRQGSPPSSTAAAVTLGAGSSSAPETNVDSGSTPEERTNREQEKKEDEKADEEDNRPWVVRVVKREARIGTHSFQLHEIYGLTAHASASDNTNGAHHVTPSSPSSSPDQQQHTYPPTPGQAQSIATESDDSPAECLLCLSAAREVVLLPCRHLVACRECAVNMVEFGAGGTVVQPAAAASDAEAPSNAGGENVGGANTEGGAQPTAPAPQTTTPATRRKRKAKGWFCPVCRQPYTSLLRITTAPPPSKGSGLGSPGAGTDGANQSGDAKRISLTSSLDANESAVADSSPSQGQLAHPLAPVLESGVTVPAAAVTTASRTNLSNENVGANSAFVNANADGTMESRGGGGGLVSLGLARPGFLRRISGRAAQPQAAGNGRERDLERGA